MCEKVKGERKRERREHLIATKLHVWWPGIDRSIEEIVRGCPACQSNPNKPPSVVMVMAHSALATHSRGLRWTLFGKHVSGCGGCPLELG